MIKTEQDVQNLSRLEESKRGNWQSRNNSGALWSDDGRFIRFGLCNESSTINKLMKSGDYIGIQPIVITQDMVGKTIGQFTSREYKKPGWKYAGSERERAQARFARMINNKGGDAKFVTYEPLVGLKYWCPSKDMMI